METDNPLDGMDQELLKEIMLEGQRLQGILIAAGVKSSTFVACALVSYSINLVASNTVKLPGAWKFFQALVLKVLLPAGVDLATVKTLESQAEKRRADMARAPEIQE